MYTLDKVMNGKLFEYCYYLHKDNDKRSICIDPGYDTNRIMNFIEQNGLIIDTILLTHGHFDHMLSCKAIQDKFNCKIYISKEDEEILYDPHRNYAELIRKYELEKFKITANVVDDEELEIIGLKVKCIATPGHTKGGFSYYIESENMLFSGDTLFYKTCGRTDLYGGDFEAIKNSIVHKLFTLPDDTKVYPGHGNETNILYEKIHNEIIRGA